VAIKFQITPKENYLHVKASGRDENLDEVMNYGFSIKNAAIKNQLHRIFCDERDLIYSLGIMDTYEAAANLAESTSEYAKIAILINPSNLEEGEFWEDVAINRGLQVKMFLKEEEAFEWLLI
jgi:hypothetical protein